VTFVTHRFTTHAAERIDDDHLWPVPERGPTSLGSARRRARPDGGARGGSPPRRMWWLPRRTRADRRAPPVAPWPPWRCEHRDPSSRPRPPRDPPTGARGRFRAQRCTVDPAAPLRWRLDSVGNPPL